LPISNRPGVLHFASEFRAGTPREAVARGLTYLLFVYTEQTVALILVVASDEGFASW